MHLATFTVDVTPPIGHPLCGGWIAAATAIDDPLFIKGVVLLGDEKPVVLASVDWTGLRNNAHTVWRAALAKAAHTTPDRVALHCIHPHNAPFADTEAEALIALAKAPPSLDLKYYEICVETSAKALAKSLMSATPITHAGTGMAEVKDVASNRRVIGADGKVKFTRTSATKNAEARAAPVGLIDPQLRTLAFFKKDKAVAALHFYATHPMSYYGDGRVSADFCGLARAKRQADDAHCFQVYFTGCAGNITAGKFNDGSKENRAVLRDRIYDAMVSAWKTVKPQAVTDWTWKTKPLLLKPREEKNFGKEDSEAVLQDAKQTAAKRNNAALQLAWLKRINTPVDIGCLHFNTIGKALFLPGEPFIEYQLLANTTAKGVVVATAGYGDGGMGYIPTKLAFAEGGYEPTVALAHPDTETTLSQTIRDLLKG